MSQLNKIVAEEKAKCMNLPGNRIRFVQLAQRVKDIPHYWPEHISPPSSVTDAVTCSKCRGRYDASKYKGCPRCYPKKFMQTFTPPGQIEKEVGLKPDQANQIWLVIMEKKTTPNVFKTLRVKAPTKEGAVAYANEQYGDEWQVAHSGDGKAFNPGVRGQSPLFDPRSQIIDASAFCEKRAKKLKEKSEPQFNLEKAKAAGLRPPLKKKSEYNQAALKKGTGVEIEHTKDADIAELIAAHHLDEDTKYYDKLAKIEKHRSSLIAKFAGKKKTDKLGRRIIEDSVAAEGAKIMEQLDKADTAGDESKAEALDRAADAFESRTGFSVDEAWEAHKGRRWPHYRVDTRAEVGVVKRSKAKFADDAAIAKRWNSMSPKERYRRVKRQMPGKQWEELARRTAATSYENLTQIQKAAVPDLIGRFAASKFGQKAPDHGQVILAINRKTGMAKRVFVPHSYESFPEGWVKRKLGQEWKGDLRAVAWVAKGEDIEKVRLFSQERAIHKFAVTSSSRISDQQLRYGLLSIGLSPAKTHDIIAWFPPNKAEFSWGEINRAMMAFGYSPKKISNLLGAL